MKAAIYNSYGGVNKLTIKEVTKPVPGDNEVLIKIHAASINSWDVDLLTGKPRVFRFWGILTPKFRTLGADVSGQVVLVGKNIKNFLPGDNVFGDLSAYKWGGFAEYVCAPEAALTLKPEFLSFEDAAALPQAGAMAWQALTEKVELQAGQRVLINGAGGGVGSYAIQIAKNFGAEVVAIDSNEKLDYMKSLGADYVYDYNKVNYTELDEGFDVIIDVIARQSVFDVLKVLKSEGHYVVIGGRPKLLLQSVLWSNYIKKKHKKKVRLLAAQDNYEIEQLLLLLEYKKIKSSIYKHYTLDEIREAMQSIIDGEVKGKSIVKMIE